MIKTLRVQQWWLYFFHPLFCHGGWNPRELLGFFGKKFGAKIWKGPLVGLFRGYILGCPPSQDASHHQVYYIFSRGIPIKKLQKLLSFWLLIWKQKDELAT